MAQPGQAWRVTNPPYIGWEGSLLGGLPRNGGRGRETRLLAFHGSLVDACASTRR
jgi:hypothetical protein